VAWSFTDLQDWEPEAAKLFPEPCHLGTVVLPCRSGRFCSSVCEENNRCRLERHFQGWSGEEPGLRDLALVRYVEDGSPSYWEQVDRLGSVRGKQRGDEIDPS
jgi:hypothetical protein